MADYPFREFGGPTRKEMDMGDGTFARRVSVALPGELITGDGTAPRLRVDEGQTGFFAGRMFRSYLELNIASPNPAGGFCFRFTAVSDFILWEQSIQLDQGGLRLEIFTGTITPAGSWTQQPVIGQNRMSERPQDSSDFYVPTATLETGGTFTGGTAVDILRVRTAAVNNQATNVGAASASERGLPAGVYYGRFTTLNGLPVNDTSMGVYTLRWEERE